MKLTRPHLQLAGVLFVGLLALLCLASLTGLFDGKHMCEPDPMFYISGTTGDCAVLQ